MDFFGSKSCFGMKRVDDSPAKAAVAVRPTVVKARRLMEVVRSMVTCTCRVQEFGFDSVTGFSDVNEVWGEPGWDNSFLMLRNTTICHVG